MTLLPRCCNPDSHRPFGIKKTGQDLQDLQDSFSWSLLPDQRETQEPPPAGKTPPAFPEPTGRSPTPKLLYSTAITGWLLSASRPEKRKNHPVNPVDPVRKNIGQDLQDPLDSFPGLSAGGTPIWNRYFVPSASLR
ncbi:MAG: hypothetical protein DRH43_05625 [Deltaproteobacteria bacterium]|nr:MAG: hypothetical protein DRH43_05625 [Deltaproteobacteria bacterium]